MNREPQGTPVYHALRVGPALMPSRAEAKAMSGEIRMHRGDLGAMSEIARDLSDAVTTDAQRELVAELQSYLAFLRLQLD